MTTAAIFAGLHVGAVLGGLSIYDPAWVTPWLQASSGERPVAMIGDYAGEYGYAARLTRPVDRIEPGQASQWLRTHPDGALIQTWRDQPAIERPAAELRPYRKGMLGVWTAEPSPVAETRDAPAAR